MTRKSVLLGLSAIGAIVLTGNANAQILGGGVTGQVGVAGQVTAPPVPTDRVTGAARRATDATTTAAQRARDRAATTTTQTVDTARDAAATGADASATTAGQASFPVGTVVTDSAGVRLGTVMAPDPTMSGSGRVSIQTSTGFITVPASSLSMQGDVAVSAQTSAEIAKPKPQ